MIRIAIIGGLFYVLILLPDQPRTSPSLSSIAAPANGYCSPNMISCGYDSARHGGKIDADFYAWLEKSR